MTDGKSDTNETNTRGTDWEVVSLTASTYAAAPGPQRFDPDEQDCTEAMFMSKHFVVPQEESGNLPSEHYYSETRKELSLDDEMFSEPHRFSKGKGKIGSDSELFDMGQALSDHSMKFGDGKQVEDRKMVEKEHDLFTTPKYGNFHEEIVMSLPIVRDDMSDLPEPKNPSPEKLNHPYWHEHGSEPHEEGSNAECGESQEAWWKKKAMSVYNHTKGTNTFWSIFVAVAMAGIVILGQRWRREKSYLQQFKWKFSGTDEKINKMAGPVSLFKLLVGGNHRSMSMHDGPHPTF